jgi:hypothetical protein
MDTKAFKLVTGEELIGKVKNFDGGTLTIEDPRILMVQPGPQGVSVAFAPLLISAREQTVAMLKESAVVAESKLDDEMLKEYTRATSNIQLV